MVTVVILSSQGNARMKKHLLAGLTLAVFAGAAFAADAIKSGPQVGQEVPGVFEPLNINNGEKSGQKNCLYCQFGQKASVMVFAREINPQVKALIKKLDACTTKNKEMCTCVIFCSDDKGLEKQLGTIAKDEKLEGCILAIDNPAGPEKYNIAKDADVTVLVYKDRKVAANFAFKKGDMKDKDVEAITAEAAKLVK
jgi:hypothetical protein